MKSGIRLITAFCWIFIFPSEGFSVSRDSLAAVRADSLLNAGMLQAALVEYGRAAFIAPDNITKAQYLLRKARAERTASLYAEGQKTLSQVNLGQLPDELFATVAYESALNAYLNADFAAAEATMRQAFYYISDTTLLLPAMPLYILSLSEQMKWDDAKTHLLQYVQITMPGDRAASLVSEIEKLMAAGRYPKMKKPELAKTLSIFPGLGFFYAGYPVQGFISIILQGGALAAGIYLITVKYYISAVAAGFGTFVKFRTGSVNRVEYLVERRNYRVTKAFIAEIKKLVQKASS